MSASRAKLDNGGNVFPDSGRLMHEPGMTLLDYFAGKAMASIMTHDAPTHKGPRDAYEDMVRASYEIASTMIAEKRRLESA